MKKFIYLILLCFCFFVTACGDINNEEGSILESTVPETHPLEPEIPDTKSVPNPNVSQREQNWAEDIEYLRKQYKQLHIDPFYFCSEEEFDWKLNQVIGQINDLDDNDLFYELAAVIAGMQDIHTMAMGSSFIYSSSFPLAFFQIGDKIYLYCYLAGYEQFDPYLLQEVVSINGIDMTYLQNKAASIISPTNVWHSRDYFANYFLYPSFLDWAGCDYTDGYMFQFLNENQEVVSIEVPVISEADWGTRILPEALNTVPGLHSGNRTAYLEGEYDSCIYIAFNQMTSTDSTLYRELFGEAIELSSEHPECNKLVIDLRRHGGGNTIPLAYVYSACQKLKELSIEQTYVLTGGGTLSAAMDCIAYFKSELNAVTVGEPSGQFTTFFGYNDIGNIQTVVLPNSQISIIIADWRWKGQPNENMVYNEDGKLYEWENTLLPDVYVPLDIEDVREGRDSALEWVFAQ